MKKKLLSSLFCILSFSLVFAQEGMWMLNQIEQLNLEKEGLEIPIEEIYSPDQPCIANAILQLGGGSASFVSSKGLVVTNHHVAFTALQRASNTENDYLNNGFLAYRNAEEIKAPGYTATLMLEMKDVTEEVLSATAGITDPVEIEKKIAGKIVKMTEAIRTEDGDTEANIASMFNGKQYIMYINKIFKDIRIVYAPPMSIGNYGGEIDNWMWPRHTGDFSFMRAYVSPEGKGNEYSEENIPYSPKVWLKVAEGDLKTGDMNFIMGYPGFTTRYRTSTSVEWNLKNNYPFAIKNFKEIIDLADELTENDPDGKLKVASLSKGLANAMKNYQGKVDGMNRTNLLQEKLDYENEFLKWAIADPVRKEKYGNVLDKEKEQYVEIAKTKDRDDLLNTLQGLSGTIYSIASQIYSIALEMDKPMEERQPGLNDHALKLFADQLIYTYNDYYEPFDKALFGRLLKMAARLPENQQIVGLEYLLDKTEDEIEQWINSAYETTKLKDPVFVKTLLGKTTAEVDEANDPFLLLAKTISPVTESQGDVYEAFSANVVALRKVYMDALYEWKGNTMYPDANSTIRFTWGPIKGYRPADAVWYDPFTTLQGMVDKNKNIEPFNAPTDLLALKEKKDYGNWIDPELNDVPVAFLNQCDITGGNSGSPVLNAKGEIIGVAFDGNYEAMISDWQYDYNLQRCIAVDFRYVLFITEKFGKAGYLLKEMGIK